jgi:hypothetical protein
MSFQGETEMTVSRIVARIARALREGDPLEALECTLPPSDLQSLMLHVYRERSGRRSPAELMEQALRVPMLRVSDVDPRVLIELERLALDCARGFDAVDLAPVAPLGINQVLGRIDQSWCLATVRSAEVLADSTTAQALESARRRRAGQIGDIRLCSRARMLRLQPLSNPAFSPHFALFSLTSAGLAQPGSAFESAALREQLAVHLSLLRELSARAWMLRDIVVSITDTAANESRIENARAHVLEPLAREFPEVTFAIDRERQRGRGYYGGLCLAIDASNARGTRVNLADGGFTDWTQRLLANRRERLLVSGMGLDLLERVFRTP